MLLSTQRKRARQENILYSLEKMQFASREQLQKIHQLGSDRNALAILNDMKEFLHVRAIGRLNVYYLNEAGRNVIGSEKETKWSSIVEHCLARNEIYIQYDCPKDWCNEKAIRVKGKDVDLKVIPDAMFSSAGVYHFLEVDRTQNMRENKLKLTNYSRLLPALTQQMGYAPTLLFYTATPNRKSKLEEYAKRLELPCIVLQKEDLH